MVESRWVTNCVGSLRVAVLVIDASGVAIYGLTVAARALSGCYILGFWVDGGLTMVVGFDDKLTA